MKYISSIFANCVLICLTLLFTHNSFGHQVVRQYHFNNYKIIQQGEFQFIEIEGATQTGKPGEPVLPYFDIMALIPQGHAAEKISVELSDPLVIDAKLNFYPQQYSRPLSMGKSQEFIRNNAVFSKNTFYPETSYTGLSTGFMNGYAIAMSIFTPVKCIPATGHTVIFRKATVTIHTQPSAKSVASLSMLKSNKPVLQKVEMLFGKTAEINTYENKTKNNDSYDILIITGNAISDALAPLTAEYYRRGYKSRIAIVNDLAQQMPGVDIPEKIRNYIISQYQNNDIQYVLLAGDHEIVPARGFYCSVQSSSVVTDDFIPADVYYSALDGTWNDDNDTYWGEPDEDDLLPDIAVGRLPASNAAEITVMIQKILSYMNNPVENELNKPFLVGEKLWDNPLTYGGNYLDLLIGYHTDNGYTTNGIPSNHNIEKLYDRDLTQEWTASTLISKINSGKSFIHHVGHSNTNYVMRLYSSDITTQNFSQVDGHNHNYTIIYTHGCICGAFDSNDCIAEEMLKINKLAAAFVGNSRYGWFNEGQTEGPSQHLHREFVNALYTLKENHIGATHMISKVKSAPWVEAANQWEPGALRWVFYDCNVLGDPFMPLWITTPQRFNISAQPQITMGQPVFSGMLTGTGQFEGYKVALLQKNSVLGTAYTDSTGSFSIQLEKAIVSFDTVKLVASGYNSYCQEMILQVSRPEGPFLQPDGFIIRDLNNGQPDYNETFYLWPYFINHGNSAGLNCSMKIVGSDPLITVFDSVVACQMIAPTGRILSTTGFRLKSALPQSDRQQVTIKVILTSNDSLSWLSELSFKINRPCFETGQIIIDDHLANNNQIVNPGEQFKMIIPLKNTGHAGSLPIAATLTSHSNIQINNGTINIDTLQPGEINYLSYEINASSALQTGDILNFAFTVRSDTDTLYITFNKMVSILMENFETGNFNLFPWVMEGNQPWIIDAQAGQGNFSARSGDIDDDQYSSLKLTVNVMGGNISFMKKTSSENNYDKLFFYVDDIEKQNWSGETSWTTHTFPITPGTHTLKWKFNKDYTVSSGSDCVWIDNILFPPMNYSQSGQVFINYQFINHYIEKSKTDTLMLLISNYSSNNQRYIITFEGANNWISCPHNDGIISPYSSAQVEIIFDATNLQVAQYFTTMFVQLAQQIAVPVELSVIDNQLPVNSLSTDNLITVFPNPFSNELQVVFNQSHTQKNMVMLVSAPTGKVCARYEVVGNTSLKINTSSLTPGMYILKVTSDNKTAALKVVRMP